MGSRSLRSPKPLSGWPRTLLAKVKRQRRALAGILKSGWTAFSGNRDEKEDPLGATRALVIRAVVVIQGGRWPSPWAATELALGALAAASATPKQSLEKSALIMACVVG
jgi:hypothetical protein